MMLIYLFLSFGIFLHTSEIHALNQESNRRPFGLRADALTAETGQGHQLLLYVSLKDKESAHISEVQLAHLKCLNFSIKQYLHYPHCLLPPQIYFFDLGYK